MSDKRPRGLELALVGALFCMSGAAALVYQVAWQRVLALHTGVGVYSVATIVAAFMLGLGLGSEWGGVLSARFSARRCLLAFAALELAIALFASFSCRLYYDVLYRRAGWLYESLWTAAPAHLLALLVPTTLMGMSLPFLARAIVREGETKSATIGYLYAINVAGAAFGSLSTPWVLLRLFGIDGAVLAAAAINAATGMGALALRAFIPPPDDAPGEPSAAPGAETPRAGAELRPLLALYALSGFCSLSLEIVWFRIVDVAVKSTAFTFGTVLALFLFGLAGGTLAGIALLPRLKDPLRAFLLCQCGLLLYSAAAVVALVRLPAELPLLRWFHAYWPGYEGFQLGLDWNPGALVRLYLVFPAALYAVPTLLMGLSFVALQQAVQDDARLAGRKVGSLQAANIAGGVAGSLGVGLVLLTWLGSSGTLRLLTACGLVFAGVGLRRYGARSPFAPTAAVLALLAALLPGRTALWERLHASGSEAIIGEDATSVVAITAFQGRHQMMVNGKGISWLPFGGIHSVIGAAPAIVHEAPLDLAIVGLGSGDTAWAAACRAETRAVTVFEIAAPQPRALKSFLAARPLSELKRLLEDPRLRVVVADGRNALERDQTRYDLIEADPLPPGGSGSGNLYSIEFFSGCARRLKPGGVMCTWAPTPRVYETFCRVFPHALEFTHGDFQYLVGSNEPLPSRLDEWLRRLEAGAVSAYLGPAIASEVAASLRTARRATVSDELDIAPNRDLFPRDELRLP